jgi:hypothetical protein
MGHVLAGQQQLDLLHALSEAGDRLVRRTSEAPEFVRQKSASKPDIEPAAADRIQHADLTGELQRMVEHRQRRARHEPGMAGALRSRGQKKHRVRAVPAIVMKIMLDDADVGEAELFRLLGEDERILKIFGSRFLLGPYVGKELHTELHGTLRAFAGYGGEAGRQAAHLTVAGRE